MRKRIRDYGVTFGDFPTGKNNLITDAPGVRVGHYTLIKDEPSIARTGLTVILPHDMDIYDFPVFASSFIINGFGKSIGLMQIEEMGTIETPIVITTTLNVGKIADSVVSYILKNHPDVISLNPVVLECNDARLNDSKMRWLGEEELFKALENLSGGMFELGSVGAGTGMVAFGFKSGIGSSSRVIKLSESDKTYHLGVLVVPNCGRRKDLMIKGVEIGKHFEDEEEPKGSIIMIIATDAPLIPRQLRRLCVRATHGLARTGAKSTNHSGDVVLAFSNSMKIPRKRASLELTYIPDDTDLFQKLLDATVEAVEEAIIDALFTAETMTGVKGRKYEALPVRKVLNLMKGVIGK